MEKDAPGDRRMGRKRAPFSIAELTPKVRQPQESPTDTGMRSAKQAASQLRTSRNNPVVSEKQAAQPDERLQYGGADNTLTNNQQGEGGRALPTLLPPTWASEETFDSPAVLEETKDVHLCGGEAVVPIPGC